VSSLGATRETILVSAALILIALSNARATEGLVFSGSGYTVNSGYTLNILIAMPSHPVIAQVQFTRPAAKDWVILPPRASSDQKVRHKRPF
jgi:hypothetical protein